MAYEPGFGQGGAPVRGSDHFRAGGPSEADFPAASLHGNHHTPHCARPRPHRRTPKATSPKASRRKRDNLIATPRASFPNPRNNKSICFRVHDERGPQYRATDRDRKSAVEGKNKSVRLNLDGV